jgi:hypothetical protein
VGRNSFSGQNVRCLLSGASWMLLELPRLTSQAGVLTSKVFSCS